MFEHAHHVGDVSSVDAEVMSLHLVQFEIVDRDGDLMRVTREPAHVRLNGLRLSREALEELGHLVDVARMTLAGASGDSAEMLES